MVRSRGSVSARRALAAPVAIMAAVLLSLVRRRPSRVARSRLPLSGRCLAITDPAATITRSPCLTSGNGRMLARRSRPSTRTTASSPSTSTISPGTVRHITHLQPGVRPAPGACASSPADRPAWPAISDVGSPSAREVLREPALAAGEVDEVDLLAVRQRSTSRRSRRVALQRQPLGDRLAAPRVVDEERERPRVDGQPRLRRRVVGDAVLRLAGRVAR